MIIAIIFIVFTIFFAVLWIWFFNRENFICRNLYSKAIKAFDEANYQKAQDLFYKVVFLSSNYKDAKYKLGSVLLSLKKYKPAQEVFEQIVKDNPKDIDSLFSLARILQFQKFYEKAEEIYFKLIKENDKNPEYYLNLGIVFSYEKDYEKALKFFEKAKELAPENPQVLFYINKCNDEKNEEKTEEDEQKIINEYLKLAGDNDLPENFYITLAKAYAKTGDIDKALTYCEESFIINPDDIENYTLLGLIQLLKKDFKNAKSTLATALSLQSNNKEVHEILSYVICQQNDGCMLEKCREKYEEVLRSVSD